MSENTAADQLVARSNRLGADARNTNYAGGNTSAKGSEDRPGHRRAGRVALGQGFRRRPGHADPEPGLAVLRLDRVRALTGVYPGVEREDEMVAAFDFCLHGQRAERRRRSTPRCTAWSRPRTSTTCTPTPASRWPPRPTARSPDPGDASATGSLWVPWRRPGVPARPRHRRRCKRANPQAIGVVLGGHGITAWADTSRRVRGAIRCEIIRHGPASSWTIAAHGRSEPFGPVVPVQRATARWRSARSEGGRPLPDRCAVSRRPTVPQVGHYTDSDVRARLRRPAPGSGRVGGTRHVVSRTTSCVRRVKPLVLRSWLPTRRRGRRSRPA